MGKRIGQTFNNITCTLSFKPLQRRNRMPRNSYRFIYTSTYCFKLLPQYEVGQSALDNLSEFDLVTIVITGYMLRYHTGEFG